MTASVQRKPEGQIWQFPNPIEATIACIQREAIYSYLEKYIPADAHSVKCIVLNHTEGRYFGVKFVKKRQKNAIAIKIDELASSQIVYVKQDELVDRWQLDKREITHSNENVQAHFKRKNIVAILNNYQRLFEKQSTSFPVLNSNLLMKIIKMAFLARDNSLKDISDLTNLLSTHRIILSFRKDKLYLYSLMHAYQVIYKGTNADIYPIKKFSGKASIIKYFHKKDNTPRAIHEMEIILKIHKEFQHALGCLTYVPGIQKPVYATFMTARVGLLQHQYEGDLKIALSCDKNNFNILHEPYQDWFENLDCKLLAFGELLIGFHYAVTQKGLIHGDIKPANIFVSGSREGIHLHLGDFGSAMLANPDISQRLGEFNRYWTCKYILPHEASLRRRLHEEICQNSDSSLSLWRDYLNNGRQSDIFALGCVLAELVAPKIPYMEYGFTGDPKPNSFKREAFIKAGISTALCDLIEKMLQADVTQRPDINQVLKTFKNLCKSARSKAYSKVLKTLETAQNFSAFTSIKHKPKGLTIQVEEGLTCVSFNDAKRNYLVEMFPFLALSSIAALPMSRIQALSHAASMKEFIVPEKALQAFLNETKSELSHTNQSSYDPDAVAYILCWALKHSKCIFQKNFTLLKNPKLEVVEDIVHWAALNRIQELLEACRGYLELFKPSLEEWIKYFAICCRLKSLKGCNKVFYLIASQLSFKKYIHTLIEIHHVVVHYPEAQGFLDEFIRKKLVVPFIKEAWGSNERFESVCAALLSLNPTLDWLFLSDIKPIEQRLKAYVYSPQFPSANLCKACCEAVKHFDSDGLEHYSQIYLYRGYVYLMQRSFENAVDYIKKATQDFSKVIKDNPNEKLAWSLRGECYLRLRKYELAINDLNQAIKLGAKHHLDFFNRSMCYEALGNKPLSEEDSQKAQQLAEMQQDLPRLPFLGLGI